MKLTDRATRKLELYLAAVRRNASPSDADDIIQNLREHVAIEAAQCEGPLNASQLDEVLERLGEPDIYSGSAEFAPQWLGFISIGLGVLGFIIALLQNGLILGVPMIIIGGLIALYTEFDPSLDGATRPYGRATGWALMLALLVSPAVLIWIQSQRGGILQNRFNNLDDAGVFMSSALGLTMIAATILWAVICYILWESVAVTKKLAPRKGVVWGASVIALSLVIIIIMSMGVDL